MSDAYIRYTAKMKGAFTVARLLKRYPEKVGRSLESLVKQEARGLAVELARQPPFSRSPNRSLAPHAHQPGKAIS